MDFLKIADILSKVGMVTLLLLIIIGGSQGMWVYGATYKAAIAERDEWKKLALEGTKLAEKGAPPIAMMGANNPPKGTTFEDVQARLQNVERAHSLRDEP